MFSVYVQEDLRQHKSAQKFTLNTKNWVMSTENLVFSAYVLELNVFRMHPVLDYRYQKSKEREEELVFVITDKRALSSSVEAIHRHRHTHKCNIEQLTQP